MKPLNNRRFKILFVRPPCHLWPIINESDNFLMPLSFPSLSAYLKRELENIEVKVIDCLPLKIGFKSLYRILESENPDIVGVGDSLPFVYEGIKVLEMAKQINPNVVTIAGGHFHSHMVEYSLNSFKDLDYIVRYEGERYFKDLIVALREGRRLETVHSIAYRQEGKIVETPPGPLIADLDTLPIPDYDAMPVEKYSPFGMLWPKAATIQGARGCPMDCKYCSWSALEGEHVLEEGKIRLKPKIRIKSVARTLEEIDTLYHKYGIRYLFWVDGTWNYDSRWVDELCTEIIRRKYNLGWWAFVRADLLLEQESSGILEKMVRAGLKHTLFGGERFKAGEMRTIGKTGLEGHELSQASHLLRNKYPGVFRQATFITGIRTESRQSMLDLGAASHAAKLDFAAYHPMMPYPGTPLWDEANRNKWIEEYDFAKYDMFFPIMPSEHLSRIEIANLNNRLYKEYISKRALAYLKGLLSPVIIRRKLHWWFLFSTLRVLVKDLIMAIRGKKKIDGFAAMSKLWKPRWYDS